MIYHAVERHTVTSPVELARKRHAWNSWGALYATGSVKPRHLWEYPRSAKATVGDPLDLPYLKDVLKFGMSDAAADDIILWTNDDTIIHHSAVQDLTAHLAKHPAVSISRCEFNHKPPPEGFGREFWNKVDRHKNHNGRDLFAFRKSWLDEHWDGIPDFILGASEFDVFLTTMIRNYYGIANPRAALHAVIPPAELPRGYVGHIRHPAKWNSRMRMTKAPAQLHNITLYNENIQKYTGRIVGEETLIGAMPKSKIDLHSVTVWSCCWSYSTRLLSRTIRVLEYCQQIAEIGRVILFSCTKVRMPPGIDLVEIPKLDGLNAWNAFVTTEVPKHIRTDFAMSVHEDGFPLRTDLWSSDFLNYDYIGAPWADGVVGNGGFCIESRKLLQAKIEIGASDASLHNSDYWVCRVHRAEFEKRCLTFAPCDVAARFSTETTHQDSPSFGFHGRNHANAKYSAGWKRILSMGAVLPLDGVPPKPKPIEIPPAITSTAGLKVAVVYVCVDPNKVKYIQNTYRFVQSYLAHDAGFEHELVVVLNGGRLDRRTTALFSGIQKVRFLQHDNSGYDIGAFQKAAREIPCDLMVFFGSSTYFQRPQWLNRMVGAYVSNGYALYGAMGNRGNRFYNVYPHIRTTAFWMHPSLMNQYPKKIVRPDQRHPFEHGKDCLTAWVTQLGLKAWVVTWVNETEWEEWDNTENGFHRGDQSNLLAFDHICEAPYYKCKLQT